MTEIKRLHTKEGIDLIYHGNDSWTASVDPQLLADAKLGALVRKVQEKFTCFYMAYHDEYANWSVSADYNRRLEGDCRIKTWGDTPEEALEAALKEEK